jgi:CheY-like chemotaxis protein
VAIETELSDVPSAAADMASIHQVVTNLGTNAAHAMPSGGKLEILLESHYVRDSLVRENRQLHEGDYAVLTVRDNGMGMDAATRARVFEPFFTTKAPGVGTGLGLAMVHGVMKDHGGAVILSSEPGKGTTVRCYFPLDQTETLSGQTATVVTPGAGQHILYVDDEPGLARIGERRLMHLGYRVTVVHNGRIALARFLTDPASFDAVVTDYTMPEMNGLELARELTTVRPELPIIMTTGYIDEFPPEAIAEAGVRRLIMKPMTIQELGDTLADILGIAPPS